MNMKINMKDDMKEDMMMPDIDWKETNSLAGLFQKIVEDCKNSLPLYEELLTKSSKLQSQLHSITTVFSSFLDTVQKIADSAYNTKGSSTDLGICLTRIVLRHRAVEDHIKTVASCLFHCCSLPMQVAKEEWKKKVLKMDKEHSKQFKKMRTLLKKGSESIVKVEKKMKRKNKPEMITLRENLLCDLQQQRRNVYEQERKSVREIGCQERSLYINLLAGLKPVIVEELAMLSEVDQLGEVMKTMGDILHDPYNNSDDKENIMHNITTCKEYYWFETPPSTPGGSLLGSRAGSLKSINSFSRSAANSDSVDQPLFRSRQNSACSQQSFQRSNENNLKKRNSTVSHQSQDSGFDSQDLSLIRRESRKQFQSHSAFSSPSKCHPGKSTQTRSPYSVPVTSLRYHGQNPEVTSLPYHGQNTVVTSLPYHGQNPVITSHPYHTQNPVVTSLHYNSPNLSSLPPRPPKPAVPLRSSSLDRHGCQEQSRMTEACSKHPILKLKTPRRPTNENHLTRNQTPDQGDYHQLEPYSHLPPPPPLPSADP